MNFRKLCRIACVFFFLVFLQGNALAATIHGTVYEWSTFEPLNNAVVKINSTPEQSLVAANSEYSFNLTPGAYQITANYFDGNNLVYTAKEDVTISGEGEYVHDLLLFPPEDFPPDEGFPNQTSIDVTNLDPGKTKPVSKISSQNTLLVAVFFALIVVLLLAGYFLFKRYRKHRKTATLFEAENRKINMLQLEGPIKEAKYSEETENRLAEEAVEISENNSNIHALNDDASDKSAQRIETKEENQGVSASSEEGGKKPDSLTPPKSHKINLPEDLREILNVIRVSGNRITQRELRKKSPYSESKVSLMLSDLEERGLIEKFKRGRGNIIRIPDRHLSKKTEQESKK
ncbi:MAG TPA: MarR family transcriptional regulator [Methanosarcina sp.]|nr:MarR family transcriptional regulator [Methanosarcina sp.]